MQSGVVMCFFLAEQMPFGLSICAVIGHIYSQSNLGNISDVDRYGVYAKMQDLNPVTFMNETIRKYPC